MSTIPNDQTFGAHILVSLSLYGPPGPLRLLAEAVTERRPLTLQLDDGLTLTLNDAAPLPDDALKLYADVVYSTNGTTHTLGGFDVRFTTGAARERGS